MQFRSRLCKHAFNPRIVVATMKTIRDGQLLGELGVNLVQSLILKMGFTWHPSNQSVEAGIDGWVELRDASTGAVTNSWIAIQSKARSRLAEDATSIRFPCSTDDVEYWMQGSAPVILVVSKPNDGTSLVDFCQRLLSDKRHSVRTSCDF